MFFYQSQVLQTLAQFTPLDEEIGQKTMGLQEEVGILFLWQHSALLHGVGQSSYGLPKLPSEQKHHPTNCTTGSGGNYHRGTLAHSVKSKPQDQCLVDIGTVF